MTLESLLASLKFGVTDVTEVQAIHDEAFARNLTTFEGVTEATGGAAEIDTKTPETLVGKLEVTAQSVRIGACTHETPVTPTTIRCESGTGETDITSPCWSIHYPSREVVEVVFDPAVTHAELPKWNCDEIATSPLVLPTSLLSAEAEAAIREWLALIGETNQTVIDGVLALSDFESHQWVLEQLEKMR
jgi:hypothetical protein